jgi:UDP-N-acetylglucosamine 2-epimerase (non-hydrolysing)
MKKTLLIFGTRPELIKLAPIINEFQKRNQRKLLYIINTAQHRDLICQDIIDFEIDIDYQFTLNRTDDSLSNLNGLLLLEFHKLKLMLDNLSIKINAVIAQGDTYTTFCAAQFSFYEHIPFIHVEAGLRTNDFQEPFPEEYYRKTIASMSSIHFAPTILARENLIAEGVPPNRILLIGNTVIDNLRIHFKDHDFQKEHLLKNGIILITIHRRENIKESLLVIINRILAFCKKHEDKLFVWIDNPGYKIAPVIHTSLKNLKIIKPVSFLEMMNMYKKTSLIITDSGGIQEEACYLGIPVLLFRTKTERIEGINAGIAKYIDEQDTDLDLVINELGPFKTGQFNALYGDGFSSKRIADFLSENGI